MAQETGLPRLFLTSESPGFEVSPHGSDVRTNGIRVQVSPSFMPGHSNPDAEPAESGRYVFSYRVRITNESSEVATLLDRHWVITDAEGESREVRGPGVVGHRPRLRRDQSFEYESFCPLATPWGTMEGTYRFQRDRSDSAPGELFDVAVGRFYLVADGESGGGGFMVAEDDIPL